MVMSLNVIMRLRLSNRPGTLARVLSLIGEEKGNLGSIDLVSAGSNHVIRDLMVRLHDREHIGALINALEELPGVQVVRVSDRVFLQHLGGKIEVKAKRNIQNRADLALVYTPGVARVSEVIANEPELAHRLTMKGNSVAIVTDGSAVLGLGNIGPEAALPVMEGKSVLFKKFAGIDAIPLCLSVQGTEEIINAVVAAAPVFGGINLEDISAPKCFEIEEKLSSLLDIPVFHDDQHGTAIVVLAGLLNALRVVKKSLDKVKIVISGAGAAGVAIAKILISAGARDIVVCDRKGAIARDNAPATSIKKWLADNTNERCVHGPLKEVLVGADIFIGVSGPGLLGREDVLRMSEKPVIFALANPEPEVNPEEILDIAGVIATGRSDFPNQINNVLVFPGVFRGALDCHARTINEEMCLAAAKALGDIVTEEQLSPEYIIPSVFNKDVAPVVAQAVAEAARSTGVSRKYLYEETDQGEDLLYNTIKTTVRNKRI